MSETDYSKMSKDELRREFVHALDDLVESGKYHVQRINEGLARTDELFRQRAREARETRPPYNGTAERFDRIDEALASLTREVVGVKGEVTGLKDEVTGLKTDVAGLKTDVAGLKTDVAGLKTDVAGLKTDVAGLKTDVAGLKTEVTEIRERMATKVELESLGEDVKRMADGYATTQQRLDRVADMLKMHVIVP